MKETNNEQHQEIQDQETSSSEVAPTNPVSLVIYPRLKETKNDTR